MYKGSGNLSISQKSVLYEHHKAIKTSKEMCQFSEAALQTANRRIRVGVRDLRAQV